MNKEFRQKNFWTNWSHKMLEDSKNANKTVSVYPWNNALFPVQEMSEKKIKSFFSCQD